MGLTGVYGGSWGFRFLMSFGGKKCIPPPPSIRPPIIDLPNSEKDVFSTGSWRKAPENCFDF